MASVFCGRYLVALSEKSHFSFGISGTPSPNECAPTTKVACSARPVAGSEGNGLTTDPNDRTLHRLRHDSSEEVDQS
jgi:hypothetical protein